MIVLMLIISNNNCIIIEVFALISNADISNTIYAFYNAIYTDSSM